jgi:hypothetical protein
MKKLLSIIIPGLVLITCTDELDEHTFVDPPILDLTAWVVNANQYEHMMTIVAQVHLDGDPVPGLDNKIAAFDNGDVCGVAVPYSHMDDAVYNLIVYSNTLNTSITFGVYLADQSRTALCTNQIIFESGEGVGTPDTPYVLEIL